MKKSVIVILHLGYWGLFLMLLLIVYVAALAGNEPLDAAAKAQNLYVALCFIIIPGVSCFYAFYTFLFSHFLYRKKILLLFLYGILVAILCGSLGGLLARIVLGPMMLFSDSWHSAVEITMTTSVVAALNGGVALVMKGFITWYGEIKIKEDLNRKNYEMELALVKSRINPHFLFNTINNIDVLIEIDPVKASAYLNKLSDIMRFMLYETKPEHIFLTRELEYIEKFIELQKIRTTNLNYVQYKIEGNPIDVIIAPMLFIPFIENAFKHAENTVIDNAISVKFVIENESITFYCENRYKKEHNILIDYSGLGNGLIQKRLELLYAGHHTLEFSDNDGMYKVKLMLKRNESKLHYN
ncbi:hypothetical protein BH10BAC2_BH10BAC2_15260 [soil metagenome]